MNTDVLAAIARESRDELFSVTRTNAAETSDTDLVLVNGQHQPVVPMVAGQWARWRTLMASIEQKLELTVSGCELQLLAKDGVYLSVAPRAIHRRPPCSRRPRRRGCQMPSCRVLQPGCREAAAAAAAATATRSSRPLPPWKWQPAAAAAAAAAAPAAAVMGACRSFRCRVRCYLVDLTHVADNQLNSGFGLDLGRDQEINGKKFKGPDDYITQMAVGTVQQWDVTGAEKRNALCLRFRVCLGWSWGWGSSSVSLQCSARVPPATAVLIPHPSPRPYSPSIPHTCGAT